MRGVRIKADQYGIRIWVSARVTYDWANRPGERWPCSVIAGHRIFAALARNGDLVEFTMDGRDQDVPSDELNALLHDMLNALEVCLEAMCQ
jgi:hypothetical protein